MDFGKPYYHDLKTPDPPVLGIIENYSITGRILPEPTNCSFIYLCMDLANHQKKVIKFIKLYKDKISRIKKEVDIMRMVSHPNIIKLEYFFRFDEYMCLILPHTPHRSIFSLLFGQYKNGIPEDDAVIMMIQMLKALKYLHSLNIIHRDIKPDNFLVFDPLPNIKKPTNDSESLKESNIAGNTNNSEDKNDANNRNNSDKDKDNENNSEKNKNGNDKNNENNNSNDKNNEKNVKNNEKNDDNDENNENDNDNVKNDEKNNSNDKNNEKNNSNDKNNENNVKNNENNDKNNEKNNSNDKNNVKNNENNVKNNEKNDDNDENNENDNDNVKNDEKNNSNDKNNEKNNSNDKNNENNVKNNEKNDDNDKNNENSNNNDKSNEKNDDDNNDNDKNNENNDDNNEDNDIDLTKYPRIILTDFGFARMLPPNKKARKYMGTYEYMAPEMINDQPYDCSIDIWALGISLFLMLTRRFPFRRSATNPSICQRQIAKGKLNFSILTQMKFSVEVIDLIEKMCEFDPSKRITAEDALSHPWMQSRNKTPTEKSVSDQIGNEDEFISTPGT